MPSLFRFLFIVGTAGAIINQTMKSGTNQLHGSIYDYAANNVLNAAQPYTDISVPTRRHDYGFTVGGPVILPKVYNGTNKSFFFMSFEEFYENVMVSAIPAASGGTPTVPIDAYRNGVFTQLFTGNSNNPFRITAINPATGTSFTQNYIDPLGNTNFGSGTIFDPKNFQTVTCTSTGGPGQPNCNNGSSYTVRMPYAQSNVIPATAFDPVSLRLLNLVPKPVGAIQPLTSTMTSVG